jgi:hypothetical protein
MTTREIKAVAPGKEPTASQNNDQRAQFTLAFQPQSTPKRTKQGTILEVLATRSLNRFEAEAFGDHCLHSTISTLRDRGHIITDERERVPTRFGNTVRVKRYYLVRRAA